LYATILELRRLGRQCE